MAHKHSVYDTDSHFKINKVTHAIQNDSGKIVLIQHDHNSERFTFEIPRMIDGHDMSQCDEVQVHYINIDSVDKSKISRDVYDINDLGISPDSDDVVICSWLINGNATKYAGSLNFLLKFKCVTDGVTEYVWNTAIHSGVSVSSGMDNGEIIVGEYSDILEQWRHELFEADDDSDPDSGYTEYVTEQVATDLDFSIDGFCRPTPKSNGELFGTNTGYSRTDYVNIAEYERITVHVRPRTDSVSPCVWFDGNKNYISGEIAAVLEESDFTFTVPKGAVYAIFSSEKTITSARTVFGTKMVSLVDVLDDLQKKVNALSTAQGVCYLSVSGSDDNDGHTPNTPVQTLGKVRELLAEDGELIFMAGDYYNVNYDLSSFAKVSTIGNVRFIYHDKKFTEAALVEGYARVYSVPHTGNYSDYLWQFDVPDANTAISAEERHPLQRNRTHRLEHTRLYPVTKFDTTSADLAGYLATMEATTDKWMYYMDGSNCYFTVPDADFASHPVIIPSDTTLKASEKKTVYISDLKVYFASILTTNLSGVLDGLTVGYHTKSGAIMWDDTFGMTLKNCEAVASTNDGINGHDSGDIVCYNCWGHDNSDDGESDHEECHIIQYGGLYEYNGNGCTPASGASGEYISTICRNNGAWDWVSDPAGTGFSAQSASTTGAAQMYCIGCYSYGNKIGFRQKNNSKATFINCVSKNDETAFGAGTQINCDAFDHEHSGYKTEEWTFELDDGTSVTKQVVVK